jgi:hypothetical protein
VDINLDAGYDNKATRALLDRLGFESTIARKGVPAIRPRRSAGHHRSPWSLTWGFM